MKHMCMFWVHYEEILLFCFYFGINISPHFFFAEKKTNLTFSAAQVLSYYFIMIIVRTSPLFALFYSLFYMLLLKLYH